jgi:hypothetical protein
VALDAVIEDEETTIAQVSPEEWDAISPSKYGRRSTLLDLVNVSISEINVLSDIKQTNRVTTEIGTFIYISLAHYFN